MSAMTGPDVGPMPPGQPVRSLTSAVLAHLRAEIRSCRRPVTAEATRSTWSAAAARHEEGGVEAEAPRGEGR